MMSCGDALSLEGRPLPLLAGASSAIDGVRFRLDPIATLGDVQDVCEVWSAEVVGEKICQDFTRDRGDIERRCCRV